MFSALGKQFPIVVFKDPSACDITDQSILMELTFTNLANRLVYKPDWFTIDSWYKCQQM